MNDLDLLIKIQEGFDSAVSWAKSANADNQLKNQLKSAMFVSKIGDVLYRLHGDETLWLNTIKVPENINEKGKGKKESGEWLLDITITKNENDLKNGFKKEIVWAVESESDCSKEAFNDDFAKLFHINSINYLYLNGLNHKTKDGKDKYIENRLKEVEAIIQSCNKPFKPFWFAFWASPCKYEIFPSIWEELDGEFKHLRDVRLFKFEHGTYKEIRQ